MATEVAAVIRNLKNQKQKEKMMEKTMEVENPLKKRMEEVVAVLGDVPGVAYAGENRGELDGAEPAVAFPCALAGVESVVYQSGGNGQQQAEVVLDVTLADRPQTGDAAVSDFWKLPDAIHAAMRNACRSVVRTGLKRTERKDGLRVYVLSFRTAYVDSSAVPVYTPVSLQPDVVSRQA